MSQRWPLLAQRVSQNDTYAGRAAGDVRDNNACALQKDKIPRRRVVTKKPSWPSPVGKR